MLKIRSSLLVSSLLIFFLISHSQGGVISPELQSILQSSGDEDEISVIATLSDRPDLPGIQERYRRLLRAKIIKALRETADLTQRPLREFLKMRRASRVTPLWLINGMAVTVPAYVIPEIAALPGVERVSLDAVIDAPPVSYTASATPEWNIRAIGAPDLWDLGFTGSGVVVANMDTGVDLTHPDLQSRWRGGKNSWYDPYEQHEMPYDGNGHGTQTMGIIVGGDAGGSAIGVAPGAKWIAIKIFNDRDQAPLSAIHQGFQWALDPDGDPDTDDAPDVVNNSWGIENTGECFLEFERDIQALKAAGIAVVFAAGNDGSSPATGISPANNQGAFSVGAVDRALAIADFSSRGPSACDGGIFPLLVAPGVSIRTSDLSRGGSRYTRVPVSGTSFSTPHVSGAMALLWSAFPGRSLSDLEWAINASALDLGASGPDNDYGYGFLDVKKAFSLLLNPSPHISVDPSSYHFGETREGISSPPKVFKITNLGSEALRIDGTTITGPSASEFIEQNDHCSMNSISSLGSCSLQVSFLPGSGGTKSASLAIYSNDLSQNPFVVTLTGIGLEQHNLDVKKMGTGTGRVTSSPAGIDCGADCHEPFAPGTAITLTASPNAGSDFIGWSGCSKTQGQTCSVNIDADTVVTATFDGPGLIVALPQSGEEWRVGTIKKVTWTYSGNPGPYVRIDLLKGSSFFKTIAEKALVGRKGTGNRYWRLPRNLPDGNDYRIQITSKKEPGISTTTGPFTIRH